MNQIKKINLNFPLKVIIIKIIQLLVFIHMSILYAEDSPSAKSCIKKNLWAKLTQMAHDSTIAYVISPEAIQKLDDFLPFQEFRQNFVYEAKIRYYDQRFDWLTGKLVRKLSKEKNVEALKKKTLEMVETIQKEELISDWELTFTLRELDLELAKRKVSYQYRQKLWQCYSKGFCYDDLTQEKYSLETLFKKMRNEIDTNLKDDQYELSRFVAKNNPRIARLMNEKTTTGKTVGQLIETKFPDWTAHDRYRFENLLDQEYLNIDQIEIIIQNMPKMEAPSLEVEDRLRQFFLFLSLTPEKRFLPTVEGLGLILDKNWRDLAKFSPDLKKFMKLEDQVSRYSKKHQVGAIKDKIAKNIQEKWGKKKATPEETQKLLDRKVRHYRQLLYACNTKGTNRFKDSNPQEFIRAMLMAQILITAQSFLVARNEEVGKGGNSQWDMCAARGLSWEIGVDSLNSFAFSSIISRSISPAAIKFSYQSLYYLMSESVLYSKIFNDESLYNFVTGSGKINKEHPTLSGETLEAWKNPLQKQCVGQIQGIAQNEKVTEVIVNKMKKAEENAIKKDDFESYLASIINVKKDFLKDLKYIDITKELYREYLVEYMVNEEAPEEDNTIFRFNRLWDMTFGVETFAVGMMTYKMMCQRYQDNPLWRFGLVLGLGIGAAEFNSTMYYELRKISIDEVKEASAKKNSKEVRP